MAANSATSLIYRSSIGTHQPQDSGAGSVCCSNRKDTLSRHSFSCFRETGATRTCSLGIRDAFVATLMMDSAFLMARRHLAHIKKAAKAASLSVQEVETPLKPKPVHPHCSQHCSQACNFKCLFRPCLAFTTRSRHSSMMNRRASPRSIFQPRYVPEKTSANQHTNNREPRDTESVTVAAICLSVVR